MINPKMERDMFVCHYHNKVELLRKLFVVPVRLFRLRRSEALLAVVVLLSS